MNPDGRSKTPRLETKMKKNLHPQPDHRERLLIPVSEFSFAACPILINHAHPNLSDAERLAPTHFPGASLGVGKASRSAGRRQPFAGRSRFLKNFQTRHSAS